MSEIVVGYDGSDGGKAALNHGLELAKELGDKLVIVFGYEPPGPAAGAMSDHREAVREFGERITKEAVEQAGPSGVETEVELVGKRGANALLDVGDKRDARMIVVASYGESPVKGAIVGSVPYRLVQGADRPVLVVPA